MSESKPFDPFMAEEIISALNDLKDAQLEYAYAQTAYNDIEYVPFGSPGYEEYTLKCEKSYRNISATRDELEYAYLRLTSALVPGILKEIKNGDYDV